MAKTYIARYEISKVVEDGDYIIVNFKDHEPYRLKKELFDVLVSDKKNNDAEIYDMVRHILSTKYVEDMALEYGLDFTGAMQVSEGIRVLVHNMRESAIAKKFDCSSPNDIKLSDILDEVK